MFEGIPTYPHPGRFWEIVQNYKVNIFYTAPTAIRALAKHGAEWPKKYDLTGLRLLGSVGEILNPEAWKWYHQHIGQRRCPIVDTWRQTETGGILISALPGAVPTKPGSAAVVGCAHDVKGEAIYAFVILQEGSRPSDKP